MRHSPSRKEGKMHEERLVVPLNRETENRKKKRGMRKRREVCYDWLPLTMLSAVNLPMTTSPFLGKPPGV